jgi:hypothetical protein
MISGKFAITIHILTLMSRRPDEYLSSDYQAGCININPVLVRKEISNLKTRHSGVPRGEIWRHQAGAPRRRNYP